MAEFLNPFAGVVPGRKLTARELTRAIRLAHAAELEAVHLYEALADATDNELARDVLQDVANEERVHAGEFLRLTSILLPDEADLLAQGAAEVNEAAEGLSSAGEAPPPAAPKSAPTIGSLKQ